MQREPNRGARDPMTTRALIRTAIPHDTAKTISRHLGVSHRQGRRIATGKVPGRLRVALVDLLDRFIAQRKAQLEHGERELREIRYAEMVDRAAQRREPMAHQGRTET
jgi:hypothetical protein